MFTTHAVGGTVPRPATIAIDGPVASGKNAVGGLVAKELGYLLLDTGAMYRALTWLALKQGLDLADEEALGQLAATAKIDLAPRNDGACGVRVNGQDVTAQLRQPSVERGVSLVATVAGVRRPLVARQQELARAGGVVVVGRDIGTVVLPDATLKIYLEASTEERARRRHRELLGQGVETEYDDVLADLQTRDGIDSGRSVSPLMPAADAIIIDTEGISAEQVSARILDLVAERCC